MTTATSARSQAIESLQHEVGVLIRRAKRVLHLRARLVDPDLNGAAYLMLAWLANEGPVRSTALVEVFGIDKGAVSRQVQHLEDHGLVVRSPDPDDGRATLIAASDLARRRLDAVSDERRALLDDRLSDWSEEDLSQFVELLARYNGAMRDGAS